MQKSKDSDEMAFTHIFEMPVQQYLVYLQATFKSHIALNALISRRRIAYLNIVTTDLGIYEFTIFQPGALPLKVWGVLEPVELNKTQLRCEIILETPWLASLILFLIPMAVFMAGLISQNMLVAAGSLAFIAVMHTRFSASKRFLIKQVQAQLLHPDRDSL